VNHGHRSRVRFSEDDLLLFSAASHDRNPRHLSPEYAHKTFYGQRVVFGIIGAFACLGRIQSPDGCVLSRIDLEFRQAMFLDVDYCVAVTDQSREEASVKLSEGSNVLMTADLSFAKAGPPEAPQELPPRCARQVPADPDESELRQGTITRGEYVPDLDALAELCVRFGVDEEALGRLPLSALLWSSYVVGMEQPGLRSLFHKLTLTFDNSASPDSASFRYEAEIKSLNSFGSLRSGLRLYSGDSLVGTGESRAFIIPRQRVVTAGDLATVLARSERLRGKTALVMGASRGLGAMLTAALCLQGCHVTACFRQSEPEARQLCDLLADAPGKVALAKGDASNVAWCEELRTSLSEEFGHLDFLICSACPPLLPLSLEPEMAPWINSYVADALALTTVPLSVFSSLLAEKSGWCGVISSLAVETTPKEWPHYVAAKCATEGLVRVAALQYPHVNFLLIRPPRMRTDLTNGPSNVPFGKGTDMMPEDAAAAIVQRLCSPPRSRVEVLSLDRVEVAKAVCEP
jgi:NAD(P)-dependent dehydrogenase (short-subunit alcohol dehydrogenase family)